MGRSSEAEILIREWGNAGLGLDILKVVYMLNHLVISCTPFGKLKKVDCASFVYTILISIEMGWGRVRFGHKVVMKKIHI